MRQHGVKLLGLVICFVLGRWTSATAEDVRLWTDSTGKYTVDAELVDFDEKTVVMRKVPDGNLISVPLGRLSAGDREFLKSKVETQSQRAGSSGNRRWTLRDGKKVVGRVLRYGWGTMTLQRRSGKVHVTVKPRRPQNGARVVNEQINNVSELHKYLIPKVVSRQENIAIKTLRDLENWIRGLKGQPRHYELQGVVLVLEDGEQFAVPFFFFSEKDLRALKPGWEEWLAAESAEAQAEEARLAKQREQSLYLRARVREAEQDRLAQMNVEYFQFGVARWEVQLLPKPGARVPATKVIASGRNSNDARAEAIRRFPYHNVGSIRRLSPKIR